MKRLAIIALMGFAISLTACAGEQITVRVRNPAPFDRTLETVEVPFAPLAEALGLGADGLPAVTGPGGRIATQLIDTNGDNQPDLLLFQSAFLAGEEKTFIVSRATSSATVVSRVDAKYILPRKDVAWENERIGFRIYGGPLAGAVRNGLDVWVKRVPHKIIDTWYAGDSLKGTARVSYHVDHGEGADMFEVGKSLGAGACALWIDSALCQPGMFTEQRIVAAGPIRAAFSVRYQSDSCGIPLRGEIAYSLDAGENLNRIDVRYENIGKPFMIAAGLVMRATTARYGAADSGWVSLWGLVNADSTNGFLGTGIVMPDARVLRAEAEHVLLLGYPSEAGRMTYYAGAGWTRSGQYSSVRDWNAALARFAERLRFPLQVTLLPPK